MNKQCAAVLAKVLPVLEPYELYISYAGLGLMALVPIVFGTRASVEEAAKGNSNERISTSDAYMFPIIGSCVLFGFYMLFKYFSQQYINMLLTAYFSMFGVASLIKLLDSVVTPALPTLVTKLFEHHVKVVKTREKEAVVDFRFHAAHIAYAVLAALFMGLYVWTKHWAANNVLGLAFALSAISLIHLDTFATGCILLTGLFFYDIFWVFKTDVMVTVAKSFDVPVKLLMPKALGEYGMARPVHMALLGLGDIVIPGVFVALCHRFDEHLKQRKVSTRVSYFRASFFAYCLGLVCTVAVMHVFKAAQPALLYLSPACISSLLLTALVNGQIKAVFEYSTEAPEEIDSKKKKAKVESAEEEEAAPGTPSRRRKTAAKSD